jgi:hypothetical protein
VNGMSIRQSIAGILATIAMSICTTTAFAVPMGYDVQIDLTVPLPGGPLGGLVDSASGMLYGDPEPEIGPTVLDCFVGGPCEITSMMYSIMGGGGTLANIDLLMVDETNPFGQFTGTASGAFGTLDVYGLLDFAYDTGGLCGDPDTICEDGFFDLGIDVTGDGASADDTVLLAFNWLASTASGAPAVITQSMYLGEQVCGQAAPCGTLDVDVKRAVPLPGTVLLFGLSLVLLGVRRRVA